VHEVCGGSVQARQAPACADLLQVLRRREDAQAARPAVGIVYPKDAGLNRIGPGYPSRTPNQAPFAPTPSVNLSSLTVSLASQPHWVTMADMVSLRSKVMVFVVLFGVIVQMHTTSVVPLAAAARVLVESNLNVAGVEVGVKAGSNGVGVRVEVGANAGGNKAEPRVGGGGVRPNDDYDAPGGY